MYIMYQWMVGWLMNWGFVWKQCLFKQGVILAFAWRHWGKPQKKNFSQDVNCPWQESKWAPPKQKSTILMLDQPA
jgi:hypothetical protein